MSELPRATLCVDGDCGSALYGANIQEGECEFVKIEPRQDEPLHEAQIRACWEAFRRLKDRIGIPDLTYAWLGARPGMS